jgi:hypothetical protein
MPTRPWAAAGVEPERAQPLADDHGEQPGDLLARVLDDLGARLPLDRVVHDEAPQLRLGLDAREERVDHAADELRGLPVGVHLGGHPVQQHLGGLLPDRPLQVRAVGEVPVEHRFGDARRRRELRDRHTWPVGAYRLHRRLHHLGAALGSPSLPLRGGARLDTGFVTMHGTCGNSYRR